MRRLITDIGATRIAALIAVTGLVFAGSLLFFSTLSPGRVTYDAAAFATSTATTTEEVAVEAPPAFVITHILTPDAVKGIYMTACTASEPRLRAVDVALASASTSEVNTIVIDIKDYTGTISYASTTLQTAAEATGCRIKELPKFIAELHGKGLYVIGRVTVFQDPLYASHHIDVAIKSKKNPNVTWKDTHGLAYIDAGARPFWDYIVAIAKESYDIGFDEINFDYVRFPSDGVLSNALYSWDGTTTKPMIIKKFFSHLHDELSPLGIPISADLFGQTTSERGDMGIGQVLENALPYFDAVSPMVYPSHFGVGFLKFANPAAHPYEVVKYSMDQAVARAIAASSSPEKLRPWLQAFDLGAPYPPSAVRAQIKANTDAGLSSWLLWNAGSVYNPLALQKNEE